MLNIKEENIKQLAHHISQWYGGNRGEIFTSAFFGALTNRKSPFIKEVCELYAIKLTRDKIINKIRFENYEIKSKIAQILQSLIANSNTEHMDQSVT